MAARGTVDSESAVTSSESSMTAPRVNGPSAVAVDGWDAHLQALSSAMLSGRREKVHAAVDRFLALPLPSSCCAP